MKKTIAITAALMAASISSAQISNGSVPKEALKNNELAFKLYGAFSPKMEAGNFVFSPYSIYMSYAALYASADGATAAEIKKLMDFSSSHDLHAKNVGGFSERFRKASSGDASKVSVFNIFWVEDNFDLDPAFRGTLKGKFDLISVSVDFEAPKQAYGMMNSMMASASKNTIKESVPMSVFTPNTLFVVQNASLFDGALSPGFGRSATDKDDFTLASGKAQSVNMMHSESVEYNYVETDDFKAFKLPYKGGEMSLIILLPAKNSTPAKAVASLSAQKLPQMMKLLSSSECDMSSLAVPRFKLDTPALSIGSVLKGCGLSTAMSPEADFGRLSSTFKGQDIDSYIHKTIFVFEEKTPNAPKGAPKHGMFGIGLRHSTIDRPFAFMVVDNKTSAVYFMGHVTDPSKH